VLFSVIDRNYKEVSVNNAVTVQSDICASIVCGLEETPIAGSSGPTAARTLRGTYKADAGSDDGWGGQGKKGIPLIASRQDGDVMKWPLKRKSQLD
jgi:hypothetical protein